MKTICQQNRTNRRPDPILIFIVLLLVAIGIQPYTSEVVPETKVIILSKDKEPIPNWKVTQVWSHLTVETQDHSESIRTNSNGVVVFPRRVVVASGFWWILQIVLNPLSIINPHVSSGPYSYIFAEAGSTAITYRGFGESGGVIIRNY